MVPQNEDHQDSLFIAQHKGHICSLYLKRLIRFVHNDRPKIVEGRVAKIAAERALLEQPFIKDPKISTADHIKAAVAAIGENIQVRPCCR